ncbi:hypothetical protein [Streptomyces sp. NPDC049585]|uniref:hypothetical protein n=1 Tax=Streptomyces sp. NPDC049585 TaxID=3155154 RepID=UPI00341541F1
MFSAQRGELAQASRATGTARRDHPLAPSLAPSPPPDWITFHTKEELDGPTDITLTRTDRQCLVSTAIAPRTRHTLPLSSSPKATSTRP